MASIRRFDHNFSPGDEDRDGPRNFGLFAIEPRDAVAGPKMFYLIQSS